MELASVTIIVPAKNEQRTIRRCVDSLLSLSYSNREIIVVDDGSTDKTGKILSEYGNKIEVIKTKGIGPSKARNLAISKSKGDFIAFTDADCKVAPDWLEELLKGFSDENTVGAGGSQQIPDDETDFGKKVGSFLQTVGFVSDYLHYDTVITETRHNPTCNSIYKREIFNKIDPFKEDLWPCEDLEFDIRIGKSGYRINYNPNAKVYHYRPSTFKSFLKMWFRYGRAHSKLNSIHGYTEIIHFIPLFVFLYIMFNLILYKYIGNSLFIFSIALFFLFLFVLLPLTGSLKKALISKGLLFFCLSSWTLGFFVEAGNGLWRKMD